jgi:hypothetical protein
LLHISAISSRSCSAHFLPSLISSPSSHHHAHHFSTTVLLTLSLDTIYHKSFIHHPWTSSLTKRHSRQPTARYLTGPSLCNNSRNMQSYDFVREIPPSSSRSYVPIMKRRINDLPHHRFDLALSKILRLRQRLFEMYSEDDSSLLRSCNSIITEMYRIFGYRLSVLFVNDFLPDELVHEIAARHEGLMELESVWEARRLTKEDFISFNDTDDNVKFVQSYSKLTQRDRAARLNTDSPEARKSDTLDQRQRYRFYTAITGVWLINEINWIFTFVRSLARCRIDVGFVQWLESWIRKKSMSPLRDELDRLKMFKFLYEHLLPLHAGAMADRVVGPDISALPLTFQSGWDLELDNPHKTRYVLSCQMARIIIAIRHHRPCCPIPHSPTRSEEQHTSDSSLDPVMASSRQWVHIASERYSRIGAPRCRVLGTPLSLLRQQSRVWDHGLILRAGIPSRHSSPKASRRRIVHITQLSEEFLSR